jgi:hypothetical protein
MTDRMFMTSADVAGALDLPSANSFLAKRAELEDIGFPLPCAWSARPLRWRADLVHAWIALQGQPRAVGHSPQLVVDNRPYLARAGTA